MQYNQYDIIGDVHGCYDELVHLLNVLGYEATANGLYHPENRKIIFVGDLVDRGPASDKVLDFVMNLMSQGIAKSVLGNHDDKLCRKLLGRDVQVLHGLEKTLSQLQGKECRFEGYIYFLQSLPSYLILDHYKLIVTHAAFSFDVLSNGSDKRIKQYCMYGPTEKSNDTTKIPKRINWAESYNDKSFIVYGHTVVEEINITNNTVCIDTGCVFGGQLTAMRYPEKEFVSVDAREKYYQRRIE